MYDTIDRRLFLQAGAAAACLAVAPRAFAQDQSRQPTKFQIGCMTLPYRNVSLDRALTGLKSAGYRYVCIYQNHRENGKAAKVLALDDPAARAKEVGNRCRDQGLEPVMMFAEAAPEDVPAMTKRIKQCGAGGIGQLLIMGSSKGNDAKVWIKNLKTLGPIARDHGVVIVAKQHGGNTGTGEALAEILRAVADDAVKMSYDAGNVMDYFKIDPLPDSRKCTAEIWSFCIKDHRLTPKDQDCGPGFGEIDHYKLLGPVAFTGRPIPLCCENIYAPIVPVPSTPEGIDALAKRAREFLEVVVTGLQRG